MEWGDPCGEKKEDGDHEDGDGDEFVNRGNCENTHDGTKNSANYQETKDDNPW